MSRFDEATHGRVRALLDAAEIEPDQVLTVTEAGSTAHAISVGQDDLDFTVVRVEPFSELVTGLARRQSMMLRTKPEGVRSEPGDIDVQVYTLRKFVDLAMNGNPSVLMIVFAPASLRMIDAGFPAGQIGELTRSKRAAGAYLGYMEQQLRRWRGERGQKNVSRPELVAAHGFDTKYAAHAVRLAIQGIEYLTTGHITLPVPEGPAERIRVLRAGGIDEDDALAWAGALHMELASAARSSTLADEPDRAAIRRFLVDWYSRRYGVTG